MVMIKKAILLFLFLFAAYSVFVEFLAPKWWHATQYIQQRNIIKAQYFIYDKKEPYTNVILGSSLSDRIVADSLNNTYNLAFGGGSIYDGFKILENTHVLPKNILIEMNKGFNREDQSFTTSLFSPMMYYPKAELPSLRDDRQPIGILGQSLLDGIYDVKDMMKGGKRPGEKNETSALAQSSSPEKADTSSIDRIRMQYDLYHQLPSKQDVAFSMSVLKTYVAKFEKKGVHVYFFEMPVDTRLENLPLALFTRKTFYSNFPPSKYKYFAMPNWKYCGTLDGIHLNDDVAMKYTSFFKGQIKAAEK